eukprot:CAMPEP_0119105822 /NCGR_PEP_ID=MMETSP1180-20130426/3684_1 /TAXON_ID=3052 ORGANISM="Chlamydomonas cf sp, Strain CCMP681" /NCGR_SAMPLE_ID=MMETSP1180 /ASSEMBLY_ACC=CAM_ASM_000741 /LENGTH=56 /DNA_ID=CAMNT_0007090977 /DNA_START=94 /DNA_END=260 /DNA_ORIENTATION=+
MPPTTPAAFLLRLTEVGTAGEASGVRVTVCRVLSAAGSGVAAAFLLRLADAGVAAV